MREIRGEVHWRGNEAYGDRSSGTSGQTKGPWPLPSDASSTVIFLIERGRIHLCFAHRSAFNVDFQLPDSPRHFLLLVHLFVVSVKDCCPSWLACHRNHHRNPPSDR